MLLDRKHVRHLKRVDVGYAVKISRSQSVSLFVTLGIIAVSIGSFVFYYRTNTDLAPDSIAGYSYALAGTLFLLLAAFAYGRYKRSRKHGVGKLNAALHWHISFAVIGLTLLLLHSFGNFNLRTGTYALYSMVALVSSGFVGRALDRMMPRLIAGEVRKTLTIDGEDRIEAITHSLQSFALYDTQEIHSFRPVNGDIPVSQDEASEWGGYDDAVLPASWDLAYITLEEMPQEIDRTTTNYRLVPERTSPMVEPGALFPGMQERIAELREVQRALQREKFYRHIIRIWRSFHVILTLLTIAFMLWHLEFAAQLLIPTFFQR